MSLTSVNQSRGFECKAWAKARLRLLKGNHGDAIIEFSLVLLVFLAMLLGIMGFGQTLYAYHFVSSAAKSAARWAAVNGSECGPTAVAGTPKDGSCNGTGGMNNGPASATDIANYVAAMAPPGVTSASGRLTTTATWPQQPNGPTVCATTQNAPTCTAKVQVSYTFNFLFPMMGVNATSVTLSSTAEMVVVH